ncbi:hypothetical protein [Mycobacterium sp. 94-17]|uniref:hypothetical protein n=1 Tax=Mycobacterium sp. 94-17 TaxID=2986147 RepID=UPI002D1EC961|nr:hypothetical protein [Mycobacterium sp. 94-17]MEB4209749.1 hypothetical protein [Mycobacterium sp. 94-17]
MTDTDVAASRSRSRRADDSTYGVITDDGIARLRSRIGLPVRNPAPPHYREPGVDAFRNVANCYGDDNPLWGDRDYASGTRWGRPIAPPPLVGGDSLIGENDDIEVTPQQRDLLKGDPLRGVHAFYSSSRREWWAPLHPGVQCRRRDTLVGVLEKSSDFAGRAVHEWTGQVFATADGAPLSAQYKLMIRTERRKAREKKKHAEIEPYVYTDEEITAIEDAALAHRPRGADPRYWEDVGVGDSLGPVVKGPLRVTDIVCWHVGMGMGLYNVRALELGVANHRRVPGFYHRDELNIPDVMQRVHWDPEFARRSGNPTTFDYGRMRETWLIHALTNWMGDDAWLWKFECSFRSFNYVGDTQWISGTIVRSFLADGDRPAVDMGLRAVNQRGVETTRASATILLPSRERGPVRLPDPPANALPAAVDAIIASFSA